MACLIVAALCAAAAIAALVYSSRGERVRVVYSQSKDDGEQVTRKSFCNILFMGTDREAALCDVMMLLNIDYQSERVTVAQIPRDTYAEYTSNDYRKINGAYNCLGGAAQTADFLSESLGIEIDHYMCIGLDTLCNIVDALGGIDINLPIDMHYSDPSSGLYIDLSAGFNHLDGEGAEHFLRYRAGYVNGDLGRIDAQKLFMAAFFNTLSENYSPVVLARLATAVSGVETDMSIADLISVSAKVVDMDSQSICMLTLPGSEQTATQSGASYYVISMPSAEKIMKEYFFASEAFDQNQLFLNERYGSFEAAYNTEADYELLPLGDIVNQEVKK